MNVFFKQTNVCFLMCVWAQLTFMRQQLHISLILSDRGFVDSSVVHDGQLAVQHDSALLRADIFQHDAQLYISSHFGALSFHDDSDRDILCCGRGADPCFGAEETGCFHSYPLLL